MAYFDCILVIKIWKFKYFIVVVVAIGFVVVLRAAFCIHTLLFIEEKKNKNNN